MEAVPEWEQAGVRPRKARFVETVVGRASPGKNADLAVAFWIEERQGAGPSMAAAVAVRCRFDDDGRFNDRRSWKGQLRVENDARRRAAQSMTARRNGTAFRMILCYGHEGPAVPVV